jgi:hypothetical protein
VGRWTAWHPDGAVLYDGPFVADLVETLHEKIRAQVVLDGQDPVVSTLERGWWRADYENVA